jgi:hypothetical protein
MLVSWTYADRDTGCFTLYEEEEIGRQVCVIFEEQNLIPYYIFKLDDKH